MGERRLMWVGLGTAMFLGFLVYLRLWVMDYSIASDETELLRQQFDLANREAMDESAEWRMRYDQEAEKTAKCAQELLKVKEVGDDASIYKKLDVLKTENEGLLETIRSLKQENAALKSKCRQ